MSLSRLCLLLCAIALAVVSCGTTSPSGPAAPLPLTTGPLPAPAGDVVLTIIGGTDPNVGDETHLDIAGIESLGTTTIQVFEPFVSQELEFTGVPMSSVLGAAGIDLDSPLSWTALDLYELNFTHAEVRAENGFLATRMDGQPIEIADGGPVRLVFPTDDGPLGGDSSQWVWSLTQVETQ